MLRVACLALITVGVLSGCATTQDLVNRVGGSTTPLDQVLKLNPELRKDLVTVEIRQYFNRVEAPTVAEVKVTETGLKDDSIRSMRTIYSFKNISNDWTLVNTKKEYQCARGANRNFQTAKCA